MVTSEPDFDQAECAPRLALLMLVRALMNWLDARSTSYLAWAWNADFSCKEGPGLDYRLRRCPYRLRGGIPVRTQRVTEVRGMEDL